MYTDSKIIRILRKPQSSTYLGRFADPIAKAIATDEKWSIGASFDKTTSDTLRGVKGIEEEILLKDILGVAPNTLDWSKKAREYWQEISKEVPFFGLDLQIGFEYPSEEAFKTATEKFVYANKDTEKRNLDYSACYEAKGLPISKEDFLLFRYCLKYSRVANDEKDAYNSPNILFYIEDLEAKKNVKLKNFDYKKKALEKLYEIVDNPIKLKSIILNYKVDPDLIEPSMWAMWIDEKISQNPQEFIKIIEEKNFQLKGFIQESFNKMVISVIPNTTTYIFNENVIGYSLEEVIANLSSVKPEFVNLKEQLVTALKNKKR